MTEHIKPLIAEFLDEELSPPEMKRVSTHCAECRDCGRELSELRSVSEAVCSLPRRPLPVGFMQRLERRRLSPPAEPPQPFALSRPARAAAFALSAGLVMLAAYDRMGSTFSAKVPTASAPDLTLREPAPSKATAPASLKHAKAAGMPLGESTEVLRAQARAVADARPPLSPARAPAAPSEAAFAVSNEELVAAIEAEKKREGIRILDRQGDSAGELKRMVGGLGDPALLAAMRGPAPIDGPTPAILAGGGVGAVRGAGFSRAFTEQAAPPSEIREETAGASGLVLASDEERAAFWVQRGLGAAPPRVDYQTKRLLLIVANDYRTVVEIAGVVEGADRVLVTYRLSELPEGATRRTAAPSYQYRVAAKSEKRVQFQRLP